MELKIYPDKILRQKCQPVPGTFDALKKIAQEMLEMMYHSNGIGLAAPQVGRQECLIVADIGKGPIKLLNPKVIEKSDNFVGDFEGCLSLPGISVKVKRPDTIKVEGISVDTGELIKITASNLLARVLQHEIDHLKGVLIIDKASFLEKMKILPKLSKLKARSS